MARIPGSTWRPIDRYKPGGSVATKMAAYRRVILHTAVSDAESLYDLFAEPGTATSHAYVARDGTTEQYVDSSIQSSANLDANPDSITVESWDGYPNGWDNDSDVPRWRDEQLDALAEICAWAHREHGIPLTKLESSLPGTRGIGWHRQGIDPWRVEGGETWSTTTGKVCPGDRRVRQVGEVVRRARQIAGAKVVSIRRLLGIERHRNGKAYLKDGRRQVEAVVRALRRHGFTVEGHRYGHYDAAMRREVGRFQEAQGWKGKDADGLVGPKTLNRLEVPYNLGRRSLIQAFTASDTASSG